MGTAKMGPLIFSMALPAMISMIINALYNIVDSIFVAKYSQDALAAVSLVYPLQMLVVAIGVGTGVGVNSLIARRLGERRQEAADLAAEHGVALSVVGGIAFFILGWGLSGVFVGAFGASEAVSTFAIQYSHIAVGMSIFVLISMMCEKIQQSGGNMIIPMCQGLAGAIINIILDPLMIFGIGPFPELGIRGAALATVIGQIFGMALGLWGVFRHQKVLNVNMKAFKWNRGTVGDIYRVGLPGIVMQSVVSVMTAGMNGILIAFSQTAVNVLGVYFKLQTFVFMPVFGINSTLFQATARGMNSLIVSVCRQLVVILPAAWILGQQFGLNAVWYAFPIAEVASFFISYILLWREYRTELRFLGTEKEKKA